MISNVSFSTPPPQKKNQTLKWKPVSPVCLRRLLWIPIGWKFHQIGRGGNNIGPEKNINHCFLTLQILFHA